jgi:hypothetical protein
VKLKKQSIEYWTNIQSLTEIEEARPTLLKNVSPTWWKSIPSNQPLPTAKNCPSFSDLFSSAYVLRMWCDSRIHRTKDGFVWETSSEKFSWESHGNNQMIDYFPEWLGQKVWAVLKPTSPWFAKTPKGYSIYQMPVMYDANPNFIAAQGVIHTDTYHSVNPPLFIFSDKEYFDIKLGTPLAIHIPFKRTSFELEVREQTEKDMFLEKKSEMISRTRFRNGYRSFTKNFI